MQWQLESAIGEGAANADSVWVHYVCATQTMGHWWTCCNGAKHFHFPFRYPYPFPISTNAGDVRHTHLLWPRLNLSCDLDSPSMNKMFCKPETLAMWHVYSGWWYCCVQAVVCQVRVATKIWSVFRLLLPIYKKPFLHLLHSLVSDSVFVPWATPCSGIE